MSVQYVAKGTLVAAANSVVNPTNLVPGLPAGVQNKDILLLWTTCRSITATVATPSGWTLLTGFPKVSGTASGGTMYVFARVRDGTESAPTVAWSGVATGTGGDSSLARIFAWRFADVAAGAQAAIDGTPTVTDAAVTTSMTFPAITTALANSLAVAMGFRIRDVLDTYTATATWTQRTGASGDGDNTTSGTGHNRTLQDKTIAAAGSTGTAAVTPSNTTSSRSLALMLALKEAFGGLFDTLVDAFTSLDADKWLAVGGAVFDTNKVKLPVLSTYAATLSSLKLYNLTGSSIYMQTTQPAVGSGGRELTMELRLDTNNRFLFILSGGTTLGRKVIAGTPTTQNLSTTDTWWRFRESGRHRLLGHLDGRQLVDEPLEPEHPGLRHHAHAPLHQRGLLRHRDGQRRLRGQHQHDRRRRCPGQARGRWYDPRAGEPDAASQPALRAPVPL